MRMLQTPRLEQRLPGMNPHATTTSSSSGRSKLKSVTLVVVLLCIFAAQVMFLNKENSNKTRVVRIVEEDMTVVRQRNLNMILRCGGVEYETVPVVAPEEEAAQVAQGGQVGQAAEGRQAAQVQQGAVEAPPQAVQVAEGAPQVQGVQQQAAPQQQQAVEVQQGVQQQQAVQQGQQRQRRLNENVHPVNCTQFQWYDRSTYPTTQRTWADAADFCTTQSKRLCNKDEYCIYGPGAPPIGGRKAKDWRREGDKWAPAGDAPHTWVQVGVWWYHDPTTTCRTHEEMFWSVDDTWSTGFGIEFFEWIACCSD